MRIKLNLSVPLSFENASMGHLHSWRVYERGLESVARAKELPSRAAVPDGQQEAGEKLPGRLELRR